MDPPVDVTVDEGDMISVKCTARGFPAPSFVWLQGTTELNDSLPRITIMTPDFAPDAELFRVVTSTLTISAANRSDAGSYACVASNNEPGVVNGEARDDFTITVNCKSVNHCHSTSVGQYYCIAESFNLLLIACYPCTISQLLETL